MNTVGEPEGAAAPAIHESHRDFLSGPAQVELRASIRAARRRLPRLLRALLYATVGILGLAIVLLVLIAVFDPRTLGILGRMFLLTIFVGREAAMLYAYSEGPSGGPAWPLVTAILDDWFTIGFTLPLVWIGLERLRGVPYVGGVVLSLEKTAVEKRAFLRRWGLLGLLAFVWFPGVGAGVLVASAIGIVSKIPHRRLLVALAVGSAAVNVFWAVGLYYTSTLIPSEGVWSYIPLACIAVLAMVAIVFAWLQRRRRHLFPIVKVQILEPAHIARLLEVGIEDGIELLYANRRILAAKLGMDPALLGRLRSVAELSMLRTVSPRHAEMLTEVGITSIRDLSVAPPDLVAAALKELELKHIIQPLPGEEEHFRAQCKAWTLDASAFRAERAP